MASVDTFGVVLTKGNRYFFKGILFKRGVKHEVDLPTREHLVNSGHFRDIAMVAEVVQPIPTTPQRTTPAEGPITEAQINDAVRDDRSEGNRVVELGDTAQEEGSHVVDSDGAVTV